MTDVPFDLADPPDDPPPAVRHAVMWRVAICLFRDHAPGLAGAGVLARCRACGLVWPCRCRRFAERALIDACLTEPEANVRPGGDSDDPPAVGGVEEEPR